MVGNSQVDPQQPREGLRWILAAVFVLVCSTAAGYAWHTYSVSEVQNRFASAEPDLVAQDTPRAVRSEPRPAIVVTDSAVVPKAILPQIAQSEGTLDSGYVSDPGRRPPIGYQMLTPPDEPPPAIAPPPADLPSTESLSELLYGQELIAKNLWGNYGWIVEPGEIIEIRVDQTWTDPEKISNGVYLTFVVMADRKGMRASGLLRYYGNGTEGSGCAVRDFTPTRVERVGSW